MELPWGQHARDGRLRAFNVVRSEGRMFPPTVPECRPQCFVKLNGLFAEDEILRPLPAGASRVKCYAGSSVQRLLAVIVRSASKLHLEDIVSTQMNATLNGTNGPMQKFGPR